MTLSVMLAVNGLSSVDWKGRRRGASSGQGLIAFGCPANADGQKAS